MLAAAVPGKLAAMAKRKQPAKGEQEASSPVLYVRMPPAVQAAFDRMMAEDQTEPKRQDVGVAALVMLLKDRGYWPPPKT